MSNEGTVDVGRRRFLTLATGVVGGTGAVLAAWPFLASLNPSERAKALGAPVEADVSKIEPGQLVTYKWRGRPVWVLRRTPEMLAELKKDHGLLRDPGSDVISQQPDYAKNEYRSRKPEILVLIGVCTHLGCSPKFRPDHPAPDIGPDWPGGFFCPCHGSRFDLAGRVFKSVPAPTNLVVPPYYFESDTLILIGEDSPKAKSTGAA